MSKPPKARVEKSRTILMSSELWHASGSVLKSSDRDSLGSSWKWLSSLLLAAFAFEAYLNEAGPKILDSWKELERLPPLAKLDLLCEIQKLYFDKSSRPRQTLELLFRLRSSVAHGRPVILKTKPELRDIDGDLDDYLGERPLLEWERLIQTREFAHRARKDVEIILHKLHETLPEPKPRLFASGNGSATATPLD